MGFYHPATLVKDAQRRGVRFAPIDVQVSDVELPRRGGRRDPARAAVREGAESGRGTLLRGQRAEGRGQRAKGKIEGTGTTGTGRD